MKRSLNSSYSKVVGAISPIDWDCKGKPTRYSIFTEWGEDYLITNNSQEKKLKPYMNRVVEAYGIVHLNDYGEKFFNLKKLNVIGYPGSTPLSPLIDDHELSPELPLHFPYQDTVLDCENDWDEYSNVV